MGNFGFFQKMEWERYYKEKRRRCDERGEAEISAVMLIGVPYAGSLVYMTVPTGDLHSPGYSKEEPVPVSAQEKEHGRAGLTHRKGKINIEKTE